MSFTIFTCAKSRKSTATTDLHISKLYRWLADERPNLFALVQYQRALPHSGLSIPFKAGSPLAASVLTKLLSNRNTVAHLERKTGVPMLYHRVVRHFVKALFKAPYFRNDRDGEKKSEDYKLVCFENEETAQLVRSFLVSSCFYLYFLALSDAYHCGRDLVLSFPLGLDRMPVDARKRLVKIGVKYENHLYAHSIRRRILYKTTGWIEYDEFYPRESKIVADELDPLLAEHYSLTTEELDFVLNYDIKYRLGRDEEGDNE